MCVCVCVCVCVCDEQGRIRHIGVNSSFRGVETISKLSFHRTLRFHEMQVLRFHMNSTQGWSLNNAYVAPWSASTSVAATEHATGPLLQNMALGTGPLLQNMPLDRVFPQGSDRSTILMPTRGLRCHCDKIHYVVPLPYVRLYDVENQ